MTSIENSSKKVDKQVSSEVDEVSTKILKHRKYQHVDFEKRLLDIVAETMGEERREEILKKLNNKAEAFQKKQVLKGAVKKIRDGEMGNSIVMKQVEHSDNNESQYRPMGRPKVPDENRKNNKVMMSFTDADYDEIQRFKKIQNMPTITATLEEFIKLGMEVKRQELLFELSGGHKTDASTEVRGKGF